MKEIHHREADKLVYMSDVYLILLLYSTSYTLIDVQR
jgi:hypothetical protein